MANPSPLCQINGGAAGSPADVGAGSVVTIQLASLAGVNQWILQCTSTDELNSTAMINASLSINQGTKSATFTAPAGLGSAVIFTSTVGVAQASLGFGFDANNVLQPSFTTTFKVNVTTSGQRVLAANETVEQSPTAGWAAVVNPVLRAAAVGSLVMAGDITGTSGASIVKQITGVAGVCTILCPSVTIGASVASPSWSQAGAPTAGSTPQNWTFAPQSPNAGASTAGTGTPGSFIISLAAPVSTGAHALLQVNDAGSFAIAMGFASVIGTGAVYTTTPSGANFALAGGGVSTYLNVASGGTLHFTINASDAITLTSATLSLATASTIQFASGFATPTISQANLTTSSGTGGTLTIQAQNETGTTSTGGTLNLTSGSGTSTNGSVNIQIAGTTALGFSTATVTSTQSTGTTGLSTLSASAVYQFLPVTINGTAFQIVVCR